MADANTPLTDSEAARVVEIYKAYLADLGTIGTRHSETNKLYVSLLSALFVLLGLTLGKPSERLLPESLQQWIYALAIVLSLAWSLTLWAFATLYGAKFSVLNSIEVLLPVQPFTTQSHRLASYLPITIVERFVALLVTVPLLVMLRHVHPVLTMVFAATDFGIVGWLVYDVGNWRKRRARQPAAGSS